MYPVHVCETLVLTERAVFRNEWTIHVKLNFLPIGISGHRLVLSTPRCAI